VLGIDSAFSLAEAVATPISDKWGVSTKKAALSVAITGFVIGAIIFSPGSGLYWLDMVDRAVSFHGLLIAGLLQILIIGWVYGADRLRQEANALSDVKIGTWFNWMVKLVVPVGLVYVLIWGLVSDFPSYGGYPVWATLIAMWGTLALLIILSLILGFGGKGDTEQ
jgi:NSS family neurotransmitter:Na+ symporter